MNPICDLVQDHPTIAKSNNNNMSIKVSPFIVMMFTLFIFSVSVVTTLPTVIHPSTDSNWLHPHIPIDDTRHAQSFKNTVQPDEIEIPVTESLINETVNLNHLNDTFNAINNPSDVNDEVTLTDEPINIQGDVSLVDNEIKQTTILPPISSENKITIESPSVRDDVNLVTHDVINSTESLVDGKNDVKISHINLPTDGNLTSFNVDAPVVQDEVTFSSPSPSTSVTSSTASTTNVSTESPKDIDADESTDKTTATTLMNDEVYTTNETFTSPSPSSSPCSVEVTSIPSVTETSENEFHTITSTVSSDVTQTISDGYNNNTEVNEKMYDDELNVTTLPVSPSPLPTLSRENNSTLTSENDISSMISTSILSSSSTNETQDVTSPSFDTTDPSNLPPSEQMTTPADFNLNISHSSILTTSTPSYFTHLTQDVSFTTSSTTSIFEQINSSSVDATNFRDHMSKNVSIIPITLTPATETSKDSSITDETTQKDTLNVESREITSSTVTQSNTSESLVTESYQTINDQPVMTTLSSRSLIYPELNSNDINSNYSSIEKENDTIKHPIPLETLDTSSRASGDRSGRRESSSIFTACMNSVEIIIVSIALIFFTASALVICLLVGFCKRKGHTFDVQDPRNPLPPSFPRTFMSKPAHHNCKVTGPAIFGSHPINRLQGYDLNNPSDILKDEHGGHFNNRSRSSPSGYSINNNNNNNNNNNGHDDSEKDSICLKPLHLCGPTDYVKKSSTLEYPVSLNGFSMKSHLNQSTSGYHSPNTFKSLPGAGRIFVNETCMLGYLPHVTSCSSNERRTSLSSRTSYNSCEHSNRRHSCPTRQQFIQLSPYMYHGSEHPLPFGLPGNCLKCASITRDGQLALADNVSFFPVSSDEIEYRATSRGKKNQSTSLTRGSTSSPLSASESADSNSSHSGVRQSSSSTYKNDQLSSTKSINNNNSSEISSSNKRCNMKSSPNTIKSSDSSSCMKNTYHSINPEVTDTKL